MASAGDLMIRIKFEANDRLSRSLEWIRGKSNQAGRALIEMNRSIGAQKGELRDVQRELKKTGTDLVVLTDRETALRSSIAQTTAQIERQTKVVQINERTRRLGVAGSEMMAAGKRGLFETAAMAFPIFEVAKAGAEFQAMQNRMRVLGLGDDAVKDLTAFANAMNIAGSSVTENLRYLLEAQGVFRESGEHSLADQLSGAKLMAPLLAKMHAVAQATGKELSEDQERYFLRFIEQAGGLASPKRAAELTDGLFRALQSSGGNVQAEQYQSFMARAGIAGSHLSNRSMFADFEPLIGELHEQAGVGLATAFKQATGIKVNSRAAAEFMKLGLWDRRNVVLNKLGGVKTTKGNPLKAPAADALQHDPVEFYRNFVLPAYEKAGIKTSEGRAFENAKLFGGTGGNLFNLIDKQLPTILRSRQAFGKTQTLDQAYNQTSDSFFGQEGKLRTAAKDFLVAAGTKGGLLDHVTSLMNSATGALKTFTAWGNAHPTAFAWIGKIVVDLLMLKAVLSVAQIGFGGLLGPVAKVWGLWSKIRAAGSIAGAVPIVAKGAGLLRRAGGFAASKGGWLAGAGRTAIGAVANGTFTAAVTGFNLVKGAAIGMAGGLRIGAVAGWTLLRSIAALAAGGIAQGAVTAFGAIRTAVMFLGQGIMRAGMMMLANPVVLAIVAIGVAIGVASYLVYRNWDKIRGAFTTGWNWIKSFVPMFKDIGSAMLDGLLSMLDPGRLAKHLWNMGKTAVSAFKGVLGIHSPSRVFADLGGFIMSGLSVGLDAGRQQPVRHLEALARRMSAAIDVGAITGKRRDAIPAPAPALRSPALRLPTTPDNGADTITGKRPPLAVAPPVSFLQSPPLRLPGAPEIVGNQRPLSAVLSGQFEILSERMRAATAAIGIGAAAAAATPAMAAPAPAARISPGQPLVGELHIHADRGMDERALVEKVMQELRRIANGGSPRDRSSFGDRPDVDTLL